MAHIEYEVEGNIALITLNRPDVRNAQNATLLHELDGAWRRAAADSQVKVILLKAAGKHFSAGHDLSEQPADREVEWRGGEQGIAPPYEWERRVFFGYSRRWRDVPKPSVAAVQGACIAGGLMLCWPCDLIVASEDAFFSDPVIRMGIPGVEYHAHTWEWGPRKAKEMLFTGRRMSAVEALETGMVCKVVPRERLLESTLELAREIAEMDSFGLAQVKRVVNMTLDVMGQHAALESGFDIHWTGHANALASTDNERAVLVDLAAMKAAGREA